MPTDQKPLQVEFTWEPGDALLGQLRKLMAVLESRLRPLEDTRGDIEAATNELLDVGLQRLDETLQPRVQRLLDLESLGFLIGHSSFSVALVEGQNKTFVLDDGPQRALFQPAAYVEITRQSSPATYAIGRVEDYNPTNGVLVVTLVSVTGPGGPFNDWTIAATIGLSETVIAWANLAVAAKNIAESDAAQCNAAIALLGGNPAAYEAAVAALAAAGGVSAANAAASAAAAAASVAAGVPPRLGTSAQTITDWNATTSNGYYRSDPGSTHAPDTTSYWYGEVFDFDGTTNYIIQKARNVYPTPFTVEDSMEYVRFKIGGAWHTSVNTDANGWARVRYTQNELDARYAPQRFGILNGTAQQITDWNTTLNTGFFMGAGAAHAPTPDWLIGHVIVHRNDPGHYVTQKVWAFATDSPSDVMCWRRQSAAGSWETDGSTDANGWTRCYETTQELINFTGARFVRHDVVQGLPAQNRTNSRLNTQASWVDSYDSDLALDVNYYDCTVHMRPITALRTIVLPNFASATVDGWRCKIKNSGTQIARIAVQNAALDMLEVNTGAYTLGGTIDLLPGQSIEVVRISGQRIWFANWIERSPIVAFIKTPAVANVDLPLPGGYGAFEIIIADMLFASYPAGNQLGWRGSFDGGGSYVASSNYPTSSEAGSGTGTFGGIAYSNTRGGFMGRGTLYPGFPGAADPRMIITGSYGDYNRLTFSTELTVAARMNAIRFADFGTGQGFSGSFLIRGVG